MFPDWKAVKLENVNTVAEKALVRLHSNNARRTMTKAEKRDLVDTLAREYGVPAKMSSTELAKIIGVPYKWLQRHISDEFKDKIVQEVSIAARRAPLESVAESAREHSCS